MSDENSNSNIPSNEEIIGELTKDLDKTNVTEENKTSTKHISDNTTDNEKPEPTLTDPVPNDFEHSDSDDDSLNKPSIPEDFVDEEQLKEINSKLTVEDKTERRKQAAELKSNGNTLHKEGKYLEAIECYTEALRLWPLEDHNERSILYSNRAASKIQLEKKETALDDCKKALELNPNYIRAYLRRAKLYEETEKLDESLEDYKKILELDPGNQDALKATVRLPPLINERNEKMKTEMLGKLKDLGNMILRPFGLSTDNFQLQQDPNSGGYSINFQQNSKQ